MSSFFDKTKIQASDIYNQIHDYVTTSFAQVGKIFTISSAYGQILSVISNLSDMILYFIEDSVTELNINSASRTQSIQGLARLTGHNATRAIAATGEIAFSISAIPSMQGSQIVIPNFNRIQCLNNNCIYTLNLIQDEVRLNVGDSTLYYAAVMQGEIGTDIFQGDGTPLQSYTVNIKPSQLVDNFYVNVYINGVLWEKYDSLYDIPRGTNGYLVKTGITGGIDIYFGNNNFGNNPPTGSEIRIEYLLTSGEAGNLREGEDISFKWIDPGFSLIGENVDLNICLKTAMSNLITFGSNPEPTAFTRLIAPKTSRSYVLANPESYIIFLQKFNYFSLVDAYTTFDSQYIDDSNIIYLFLIPDINSRLQTNENYFTVPEEYFTLTSQEQTKVLDLIINSGSQIVSTVVKLTNPVLTYYVLNISLITFSGYSQDVINNTIIDNLSQYFLTVKRRDIIPASDIVRIVESVNGVDAVNVNFICLNNEISKTNDPTAPTIGLDDFGDIIIAQNELPIIRGGWTDRNGVYYDNGIYSDRPCSVNITVKKTLTEDVNAKLFQSNVTNIMNR